MQISILFYNIVLDFNAVILCLSVMKTQLTLIECLYAKWWIYEGKKTQFSFLGGLFIYTVWLKVKSEGRTMSFFAGLASLVAQGCNWPTGDGSRLRLVHFCHMVGKERDTCLCLPTSAVVVFCFAAFSSSCRNLTNRWSFSLIGWSSCWILRCPLRSRIHFLILRVYTPYFKSLVSFQFR